MAKRVVEVELSAKVAEYKRGMAEAAAATRTVGTEGQKLAQTREAFNMLGRSGVVAGGLIAAGVGVAIAKYAEFDQAMSYVIATGEDAAENQDALREAALEAGAATVFSATESANAIEELSKAGLDAKDILGGGLKGSLDLAAAGGLGVAEAAGIASTTLKQFRLDGSDASHVADLLAAGAGKAMGDVRDMSMALAQAGLVSNQFGLSVEETVGSLSAFASAGLLGSDAGTSFRTMLLRLANPTGEAAAKMKELGIDAYDASGQFIGMAGLAGELETGLKGLTEEQQNAALAIIFGQDAIRGANVLLEEGSVGIQEWTDKVNDQGYAAETAATRLDNLRGDVEKLQGALDTAFISMGQGGDGPLRAFVQSLSALVDKFNELPDGGQQAVFWIGAAGAAALTAGGLYLLAIPKIAEYTAALELMGTGAQRTGRFLGALGKGAAIGLALSVGLPMLVQWAEELEGIPAAADNAVKANKSLAESLDAVNGGLKFENLGQGLEGLVKIQTNGWDRLTAVWDKSVESGIDLEARLGDLNGSFGELASANLPAAQAQFRKWAEATDGSDEQILALVNALPTFRDQLIQASRAAGGLGTDQEILALALGEGSQSADTQARALEELQGVATDTETEVNALADAIRNFGSATFDVESAAIGFQQSLADLQQIMVDGTGSWDITTEAGRNTRQAMLDVASSTNDYAAAVAAMGGGTAEVQGILEAGRQKLFEVAFALTGNEQAALDYANQLIATPETIATQVALNGVAAAEADLLYLARTRFTTIQVTTVASQGQTGWGVLKAPNSADGNIFGYGNQMQQFANGGFPEGIYAGRPGGIHKFAEPETGWEAYISGKADQRARNIGLWMETGRRLGVGGGGSGDSGASRVIELGPKSIRALTREVINMIAIDEHSIATAANAGNADVSWQGGGR